MLALSQLWSLMNYARVAVFVLFPLSPSLVFQFHICLCESGKRRHSADLVFVCGLRDACVVEDGCALWCVQLCCGNDGRGLQSSAGSFQAGTPFFI